MKIRVKKNRWYLAIINLILLMALAVCVILFQKISRTLDSVQAADRWRGESDMRFAQIGCFMPVDNPKTEEEILSFRRTLDQKLIDASLTSASGTALYCDAYSGQGKLTVTGDHGSSEVTAIGVGGNFFLFHPLQLRSGSYITGQDLMQDRVILDETLAWQLFGGSDVAGMTVMIQNQPFYVAGVIRRENDFASQKAYGDAPGMFISYSAFQKLTGVNITCYEIVMPDMISGFALSIMRDNFDVGTGDLVENSSRYRMEHLFGVISDYGLRSMRTNGVIYPYWENAVRLTEDYLALLLVLILILGVCPFLTFLVIAIRFLIRVYRKTIRRIPERADALREKKREKIYAKNAKR